ncbi:hypothetical protein DK59_3098 [Brucella abortus bv. 4 str. 292]|nr:hypothetical protein DK59_3098 [Brucella abortus bv. 4 str. 292]
MTEPRALHIIGAVCFLRFKRAANEIGKLAHGAQVELQGFAVPFQLLLQAVEKRLQPLHCGRYGGVRRLFDRLVEIIKSTALARIDFRKIGVSAFQKQAGFRFNDIFQTLDCAHEGFQRRIPDQGWFPHMFLFRLTARSNNQ